MGKEWIGSCVVAVVEWVVDKLVVVEELHV